jgi:hypothetical protein
MLLLGLRVRFWRILGEAIERHKTAMLLVSAKCGHDVLRMLVNTPGVHGGGGMPHRIMVVSGPASLSRITGAG